MPPGKIAVLGGGLTGLSSAYHLSRRFPTSQVVLLEKQARLGGWVRSERVTLPQIGASVLLEAGPRSLRPNGKSVLELINLLKLEDKVITVPQTSPPAKARYLYIPKSNSSTVYGLQRLPSSVLSLLGSPFLSIMLPAILREPFKRANRPPNSQDESVDAFLSRRFGETFARMFGSALVHGIYAADSRKLSIRAAFPSVWKAEERGCGSMVRGLLMPGKTRKKDEEVYDLGRTLDMMHGVSVYSFRDGMETLTKALEDHLRSALNVSILENTAISGFKQLQDRSFEILHSRGDSLRATHVVSALPLPILQGLISESTSGTHPLPQIPHLADNPTSTVRVVNLVFPCPPKDIHPEGFGYLIPRPASGYPNPSDSSSSGILGIVFDSCSLHEQDLPHTEDYYNNAPHTKLTVMTGGPYPKLPLPPQLVSSESTSIPPFIRSLLDKLEVQLGRHIPDPVYWRIWNNEACIPTLLPGHLERMEEMQAVLHDSVGWNGKLVVVGAGVGGVSVGDCVEAGRRVGRDWT
ncbi:protoporphyrinogen oxidase [Flammula alnicola]|nr:protoporphyrinogen oxidase [Flammula alnicola]